MSLFLHTDITAVSLHENYILAGIGSHVNVLCKTSHKHLLRKEVLNNQKIYGFKSSKNDVKILVFGGKQFAVVSLEANDEELLTLKQCDTIHCDDWLHAMVWTSCDEVAALTAHNVVQIWNIETKTISSKCISRNNSILYSGLLLPLDEDVLVFAGTVFSEVIVHCCKSDETMHLLKGHRGVIFSIACDPEKEIIVTTSDDRSVRIWGPNNCVQNDKRSKIYWQRVDIVCKHEVYGHLARVMRCVITDHCIVSVGEDAAICYWSFNGKLEKKSLSHQHGSIWSVAANQACLVTGGGDGSIITHPLTVAVEHGESVTISVSDPKKLAFTAKGNIVILCVNDDVVYHDVNTKASEVIRKLNDNSSYKLLSTSSCRQIISIVDMCGNLDIFFENCRDNTLQKLITAKLEIGRVLSMQWAGNRHLAICCDNGCINVLVANGSLIETYAKFVLPNCKERWLTAAAIDLASMVFAFGDRCGNIHFYSQNQPDPVKTIRKVHGRYGPTSITIKNDKVITTGRDGTIKYFSFGKCFKYMSCIDLGFQWVEKFLDKSERYICGFQERTFVVYDLKSRTTFLELPCGGGHRAWDANRFFSISSNELEELITLVYLKNSVLHKVTFPLSKIISKNVISGSHIKETNCLTTYHPTVDEKIIFISGGEDTTLRISSMYNTEMGTFRDECIFKHLSNVRCLKAVQLFKDRLLVVSAGGRAQICVKILQFVKEVNCLVVESENIVDHLIKGTDKERKGDQNWRNCTVDFDPETRIMCLEIVKLCDDYLILAGCSDALLRIYKLSHKENSSTFLPIANIKYHSTCILTIHAFTFKGKQLLASATTTGEVVFWDLFSTASELLDDFANVGPIFVTRTNKSGINSLATEVLKDSFLLATGGDDNAIHLQILKSDTDNANRLSAGFCYVLNTLHSGLVSGLYLFDCRYLVSTSTDQRVTLTQWSVSQNGLDSLFVSQAYSDVADIHGLDIVDRTLDYITVCVYGKGFEIIKIPIPR